MLLVLGLVIAGIGLVVLLAPSIPWLGRLPVDIRIERDNFRFYFPVVTCLLVSLFLSLLLWAVSRFWGWRSGIASGSHAVLGGSTAPRSFAFRLALVIGSSRKMLKNPGEQ